MRLMDSDICVDLLRQFPPAVAWITRQTEQIGVPGFVTLELIVGCQDGKALQAVRKLLAQFAQVWPSEADMERAVTEYAPLRLSHGLGGFDAMIATTAVGIGAELLTFNKKHFSAVPGLIISEPYAK